MMITQTGIAPTYPLPKNATSSGRFAMGVALVMILERPLQIFWRPKVAIKAGSLQ